MKHNKFVLQHLFCFMFDVRTAILAMCFSHVLFSFCELPSGVRVDRTGIELMHAKLHET